MADRIKVLIVDDIPETRDHLSKLLGFEADVEVVGAAAGGLEAIEMATALTPAGVSSPGLTVTLQPMRPGLAWTRTVEGSFAGPALVAGPSAGGLRSFES